MYDAGSLLAFVCETDVIMLKKYVIQYRESKKVDFLVLRRIVEMRWSTTIGYVCTQIL